MVVLAIGLAACHGRSPSGPTPLPPAAPSALGVTAISPSTGSTVRTTQVTISGTGFLAGATVIVDVRAVSVIVVNSSTITANIPARTAGPADVVVTNPDGSRGMLTAAFTFSSEEPYTVTASTDAVDAGGQMSVTWRAPSARPGDWIAICPVGGRYDDDWWGSTHGETSGTKTLTAPTRPGQYEFRYLADDGFLDLARSSPVTVR